MSEQAQELDPLIGTVIQDRYRVVSRIGEGGAGVVYMVEHTLVGRRYALKLLDQSQARNPVVIARFHREARSAAAVGDEHIVEVIDMGNLDNGSPFLVMEYLEGRDLSTELAETGPMPIVRAVDIATQCCRALGEAHKKGIVHRDIKPENIFLTERRDGSDFIKILDFGISKILEAASELKDRALTRTGTAIGTPHYMSIEQVDGFSDIDARTDVYAMGVVLFQMLIGRAPFDAPTYAALVMKVANEPPPSLVALRSDIPLALEQVVHRALAKKREDRYATMAELAEALIPFAALRAAPELTRSGIVFNRSSTPSVWERRSHATSRFWSTKTLVVSGLAGVIALGASIFLFTNLYGAREALSHSTAPSPSGASSTLRPSAPAPSKTPAQASSAISAPESSGKPLHELGATETVKAADGPQQTGSPSKAAYSKEASNRLLEKATTRKGPRSQQDRNSKPSATPVSRTAAATAVAKPEPPDRSMRTITLHNVLRSSVRVTFRCGNTSTTTTVSAMSEASATVPHEACQVSCVGVGGPECPALLGVGTSSLAIH